MIFKFSLFSIVELGYFEVFVGYVVCDDIVEVYEFEVIDVIGVFFVGVMCVINVGLVVVFVLD